MTLAILCTTIFGAARAAPRFPSPVAQAEPDRIVRVGWHDELDARSLWTPLKMENKAFVAIPAPGTLFLGLDQVPPSWAYRYQWSGVTQEAYVDVARFPVLMARVTQIHGYAHLDIDVMGSNGVVLKTLRTRTLNDPGLSSVDLGGDVATGFCRLRLRLIVGGSNDGCCAAHDWVRFVGKGDADFLTRNPDWSEVRLAGVTTLQGNEGARSDGQTHKR